MLQVAPSQLSLPSFTQRGTNPLSQLLQQPETIGLLNEKQLSLPSRAEATIYVADLPLTVQYQDLQECFERYGECEIIIKRSLLKMFHFAFVMFKDSSHGKTFTTNM